MAILKLRKVVKFSHKLTFHDRKWPRMTFTSIHFYLRKFSSIESRLNRSNSLRAGAQPGARIFQNLSPEPGPALIPGGTIVSMGFLIPAGTHKNFEIFGIEKISKSGYRPLLAIPILSLLDFHELIFLIQYFFNCN